MACWPIYCAGAFTRRRSLSHIIADNFLFFVSIGDMMAMNMSSMSFHRPAVLLRPLSINIHKLYNPILC